MEKNFFFKDFIRRFFRVAALASILPFALSLSVTGHAAASGGANADVYDMSALSVAADGALGGTINVKRNGVNASGVAVTLTYATSGGVSAAPVSTDLKLGATDMSGNVAVVGDVTSLPRNIRFSVKDDKKSSVIKAVGATPENFITGEALAAMDWSEAKAYCASHGGRSPRLNDADSYPSNSSPANPRGFWPASRADRKPSHVEGLGDLSAPWPDGASALPGGGGFYWLGTKVEDRPDSSWGVLENGRTIYAVFVAQSFKARVACVP